MTYFPLGARPAARHNPPIPSTHCPARTPRGPPTEMRPMKDRPDNDAITVDVVLPERLAALRDHFTVAWQKALAGERPPTVNEYVAALQEPDRTTLRKALERLDAEFRARCAADPSAGTVDAPKPDASTVDKPAQAGPGTVDFRPAEGPASA